MNTEVKAITIVNVGAGYGVSIPGEAIRLKESTLKAAAQIVQVTNPREQELASTRAGELKWLSQQVEKTRAELKKPFWDTGVAIDAKAKEFRKEIDERVKEIETLLSNYQHEEQRKAEARRQEEERQRQEAARALQREQERLEAAERARKAAEIAAQQAEQRRLQAEIDAAEAVTKKAKAEAAAKQAEAEAAARKAQQDAERAQQEAEQAEIDAAMAQDMAAEANTIILEPEPAKPAGMMVKEKATFEVTDIEAFYAWDVARRKEAEKTGRQLLSFVKLEVSKSFFGQYISVVTDEHLAEIPGVVITRGTKAITRTVSLR